KRSCGRPSLTWPESVDAALCFGWIDGVRRRIDAERYTIRFTPRRPGSVWSAVNRARVRALSAAGRMQAPGLAAFAGRVARGARPPRVAAACARRPPATAGGPPVLRGAAAPRPPRRDLVGGECAEGGDARAAPRGAHRALCPRAAPAAVPRAPPRAGLISRRPRPGRRPGRAHARAADRRARGAGGRRRRPGPSAGP